MAKARAWAMIPCISGKSGEVTIDIKPIVLCKDCKYKYRDGQDSTYNLCKLGHGNGQPDEWFCADGDKSLGTVEW